MTLSHPSPCEDPVTGAESRPLSRQPRANALQGRSEGTGRFPFDPTLSSISNGGGFWNRKEDLGKQTTTSGADCTDTCVLAEVPSGQRRTSPAGAPSQRGTCYIVDNVSLHKCLLSLSVSVI